MPSRTSDSRFSEPVKVLQETSVAAIAEYGFPAARRPQIVIPLPLLKKHVDEFLLDCQYRQLTLGTIAGYRNIFKHFFWFFEKHGMESCSTQELKQFCFYLLEPPGEGGRWDNPHLKEPLRPMTAKDYHTCLRRLFNWMVMEEIIAFSPMLRVPPPVVRTNLKQPVRPEQVTAMLNAARFTPHPARTTAIVLFLFDTGLRAAELCSLKMKDMDFNCRQARVVGKGKKTRMCYWGIGTGRALARYLRHEQRSDECRVFTAIGGTNSGGALTPQGLYKIIRDVGGAAGVKCGCHDFRRGFACSMLKGGANLISVQRLMGHETLSITQGYLNIAQADIEEQHRQFSPSDRLRIR